MHYTLNPTKFNRISTCQFAKKNWDKLKVIAIQEAKNLNKVSFDEICGSLFTYEQEVNQIDEEEKLKVVEKKERLSFEN